MRQHLTYANVVSTLCLFLVLGGGIAYAANTVFSDDIVDGQVRTPDLANGGVANAKLAGGAVTSEKVADESLRSRDVLDNNLKGVDIDESTLTNIGGGGPAGGDLTGTYPNPQIAPNAVGTGELGYRSVTVGQIGDDAVGYGQLAAITRYESSVSIPANGGVGELYQNCPLGELISGGASFAFPSGDLSASHPVSGSWFAEGQNNGTVAQDLTVYVTCLGFGAG